VPLVSKNLYVESCRIILTKCSSFQRHFHIWNVRFSKSIRCSQQFNHCGWTAAQILLQTLHGGIGNVVVVVHGKVQAQLVNLKAQHWNKLHNSTKNKKLSTCRKESVLTRGGSGELPSGRDPLRWGTISRKKPRAPKMEAGSKSSLTGRIEASTKLRLQVRKIGGFLQCRHTDKMQVAAVRRATAEAEVKLDKRVFRNTWTIKHHNVDY